MYLPKEWASNPARCRKAGIPEAERKQRSKSELALEMVRHQEAQAHQWHLIVRREMDSPETIKYTLSNAPEETQHHHLAQMQAQRF